MVDLFITVRTGIVARMEEKEYIQNLGVGCASYKRLLRRQRGIWEDNIEADLRESTSDNV
jgi:hypothetical protein